MAAQADFQEFTSTPTLFFSLVLTTRRVTGPVRTDIDDPPVVPVAAVVLREGRLLAP
jgi:hypothetical protein